MRNFISTRNPSHLSPICEKKLASSTRWIVFSQFEQFKCGRKNKEGKAVVHHVAFPKLWQSFRLNDTFSVSDKALEWRTCWIALSIMTSILLISQCTQEQHLLGSVSVLLMGIRRPPEQNRVHWSLKRMTALGERPEVIIAHFHWFQDKQVMCRVKGKEPAARSRQESILVLSQAQNWQGGWHMLIGMKWSPSCEVSRISWLNQRCIHNSQSRVLAATLVYERVYVTCL